MKRLVRSSGPARILPSTFLLSFLQGAPGQAGMPGPPGSQGAAVSDYFDDWIQ